ncbi:hypothetical protein [Maledivibacter halophilus]|uniref:Uncharacterized protein n=1 Tax=Maledivibacter halophilus TaxID=36842 RepID=A0A1T5M9X1_9FIRM|nr:hypothetical protein [Maledivibacter halophilus]SKC84618.1 hypothetical protein SAMN02194393_04185 [Maledivibacter halophilus]
MNPVKACKEEGLEYKWSSHNEYLKQKSSMINCEFPLSLFSYDKNQRKKMYIEFIIEKEIDKELSIQDVDEIPFELVKKDMILLFGEHQKEFVIHLMVFSRK